MAKEEVGQLYVRSLTKLLCRVRMMSNFPGPHVDEDASHALHGGYRSHLSIIRFKSSKSAGFCKKSSMPACRH